jgi:hypothetical protein
VPGLWMLPLCLALLADDLPRLKPPLERVARWMERAWRKVRGQPPWRARALRPVSQPEEHKGRGGQSAVRGRAFICGMGGETTSGRRTGGPMRDVPPPRRLLIPCAGVQGTVPARPALSGACLP